MAAEVLRDCLIAVECAMYDLLNPDYDQDYAKEHVKTLASNLKNALKNFKACRTLNTLTQKDRESITQVVDEILWNFENRGGLEHFDDAVQDVKALKEHMASKQT